MRIAQLPGGRCVVVASVLMLSANTLLAQGIGQPRAELWQKAIQGPGEYEIKQVTVTPGGVTWLLVRSYPKGRLDALPTQELRWFDASGEEGSAIPLEALFAGQNVEMRATEPVIVAGDGDALFLFAISRTSQVIGVRVDDKKGHAVARALSAAARDRYIGGAVVADKGTILLVGHVEGREWRLKVNSSLERVWEKEEQQNGARTTVFVGAAVQVDGRFAVVGARLPISGPASSFVAICTGDGQVVRRREFSGGVARVARDSLGYVVVHSVRGEVGWDVWIRAFTADLNERWTYRIAVGLVTPFTFEIGAGPAGDWVVTGEQGRQFLVLFGGIEGPGATYIVPPVNTFWQRIWSVCPPARTREGVMVAGTLRVVDADGKPLQIGQLMKLKL